MADVQHVIHEGSTDRSESTAVLLVVLLLAIVAIAAFAFFAFRGAALPGTNTDATPGTDVNVEGSVQLPSNTTPATPTNL